MTMPVRMLLTGGGTGGHLFPGLAAAQALQRRRPGSEVLFIGTRRKIDTARMRGAGIVSRAIFCHGLKGKNLLELAKALGVLPVSLLQAMYHIHRFRPQVALGVGGYVTGPVMLAARLLGVPTIIHEQNSVPGLANRKLGRLVDRICVSLPGSEVFFPRPKVVLTGNPVRENILELAAGPRREPGPSPTVLVLGGSQGARGVNTLVTEAFCGHRQGLLAGISLIHQTGSADCSWVRERYSEAGQDAETAPFFDDMAQVYKKADLVVSRAGATTLSELAVLGKPAVLVPYPYAADNHQQRNGSYYEQGGGALQFTEETLTGEKLAQVVHDLIHDHRKLAAMGEAMQRLGCPQAAEKIVDICLATAGSQQQDGTGTGGD